MSKRLKEMETEVGQETHEVFVFARLEVDSARDRIGEIPDAMICNGAAEARRAIISLLDKCDKHFLSAMQSIHSQYGKTATTKAP
jgi:hypothetical protein